MLDTINFKLQQDILIITELIVALKKLSIQYLSLDLKSRIQIPTCTDVYPPTGCCAKPGTKRRRLSASTSGSTKRRRTSDSTACCGDAKKQRTSDSTSSVKGITSSAGTNSKRRRSISETSELAPSTLYYHTVIISE